MPIGPGKYGANAEALLRRTQSTMCVVFLVGGPEGGAFDVATVNPTELRLLPTLLRELAAKLEADEAIEPTIAEVRRRMES